MSRRDVLLRVGETAAQSVAIKPIDSRLPIVPSVGNPSRAGEALIVVEKDPVLRDVRELIGIK